MDKVREVLNARLRVLETTQEDVDNQINFFNEQCSQQVERRRAVWAEQDSIYDALTALEAAYPSPVPTEDYDDIPF